MRNGRKAVVDRYISERGWHEVIIHATCSKEIMEMWNWIFDESIGQKAYMGIGIRGHRISHQTYDGNDRIMLPGSASIAQHGPHVFNVYVDHFVDAVFMSLKWGPKLS